MEVIEKALVLCLLHLVGDFVLQNDFIARSKADRNAFGLYHLAVHALLYGGPFLVVYGFTWRIAVVVLAHILVDLAKVRKRITYWQDQVLHYCTLTIFFV